MRLCEYPRPADVLEVLAWERTDWDFNRRRKPFQKAIKDTIARLGLPPEYETMRRAGLYGRVLDPDPLPGLLTALIGNLRINGYICPDRNGKWEPVPLTARQLHAVRLAADGLMHTEISALMGISRNTVSDIMLKAARETGARNPSHLVSVAYRFGWLPTQHEVRRTRLLIHPAPVSPGYRLLHDERTT